MYRRQVVRQVVCSSAPDSASETRHCSMLASLAAVYTRYACATIQVNAQTALGTGSTTTLSSAHRRKCKTCPMVEPTTYYTRLPNHNHPLYQGANHPSSKPVRQYQTCSYPWFASSSGPCPAGFRRASLPCSVAQRMRLRPALEEVEVRLLQALVAEGVRHPWALEAAEELHRWALVVAGERLQTAWVGEGVARPQLELPVRERQWRTGERPWLREDGEGPWCRRGSKRAVWRCRRLVGLHPRHRRMRIRLLTSHHPRLASQYGVMAALMARGGLSWSLRSCGRMDSSRPRPKPQGSILGPLP